MSNKLIKGRKLKPDDTLTWQNLLDIISEDYQPIDLDDDPKPVFPCGHYSGTLKRFIPAWDSYSYGDKVGCDLSKPLMCKCRFVFESPF